MYPKIILFLILLITTFQTDTREQYKNNVAFESKQINKEISLGKIIDSGELLITMISGPETYFDYHGIPLGTEYAMAKSFAHSMGISIRLELSRDTTELIEKLQTGNVDIIAQQLPISLIQSKNLIPVGPQNSKHGTAWSIDSSHIEIKEALKQWLQNNNKVVIKKLGIREKGHTRRRQRKLQAQYISLEKNKISIYDQYFKNAARYIGLEWDWKLVAAQCYQESGFDTYAVSWTGAKGLMQIMPQTAKELDIAETDLFNAQKNIASSARYIKKLKDYFSDINDQTEKIKFILAAYNAGLGHIQDAQALTIKYGKDAHKWNNVKFYVQHLSENEYYCDPVVKYGYMIGTETYEYVEKIISRWNLYKKGF